MPREVLLPGADQLSGAGLFWNPWIQGSLWIPWNCTYQIVHTFFWGYRVFIRFSKKPKSQQRVRIKPGSPSDPRLLTPRFSPAGVAVPLHSPSPPPPTPGDVGSRQRPDEHSHPASRPQHRGQACAGELGLHGPGGCSDVGPGKHWVLRWGPRLRDHLRRVSRSDKCFQPCEFLLFGTWRNLGGGGDKNEDNESCTSNCCFHVEQTLINTLSPSNLTNTWWVRGLVSFQPQEVKEPALPCQKAWPPSSWGTWVSERLEDLPKPLQLLLEIPKPGLFSLWV